MVPSSGGSGSPPRQQHENRSGSNPIGENSRSTQQWKDVPRGTMDEVSPLGRLDLPTATQGRPKDCSTSSSDPMMEDCSTSSSDPMMEGPWCRFRREARAPFSTLDFISFFVAICKLGSKVCKFWFTPCSSLRPL